MAAVRKAKPYSRRVVSVSVGECPRCGKQRYLSRSEARKAARRLQSGRMNAYTCNGYWHIGHQKDAVRQGRATRDQAYA